MKISIIIPSYQEEKRIGKTLKAYCEFFKGKLDFEIIVVINNTTDRTEEIVKEYEGYKEVRYLNLKERGKGNAIKQGFKDALTRQCDLIGFVDADMSTKPNAFYDLIKNIGDCDGIIASRRMKESQSEKGIKRAIISFTFNTIMKMLFFLNYRDTQCGAKIFKREAVEKIVDELKTLGWVFDIEILYRLKKENLRVKEYPTVWRDVEGGSIKLFTTSWEMLCDLIKLRWCISEKKKV